MGRYASQRTHHPWSRRRRCHYSDIAAAALVAAVASRLPWLTSALPGEVTMHPDLSSEIGAIAADHRSGASSLVRRALAVLRDAGRRDLGELRAASRSLCEAQPCMASIWNAAAAALEGESSLERFARHVERGMEALGRFALDVVAPEARPPRSSPALRVVTWSSSATVRVCLERLAERRPLRVSCAEGRPVFEGRDTADALARLGIEVDLFTDAGIARTLAGADAVLVGADAVGRDGFVNKCGTGPLALAAEAEGVPTFLVAGRDKWISPSLEPLMRLRNGPPDEVWAGAPAAVRVHNPYFERVPLHRLAGAITDVGVLAPDMLAEAVERERAGARELRDILTARQ